MTLQLNAHWEALLQCRSVATWRVQNRHTTHINHIELPPNINTSLAGCMQCAKIDREKGTQRGGPLASATPCGPWPSAKQRRVVSLDAAGQVKSFAGQQNTTNWHWQLSKRLAHFSRQLHTVSRSPRFPLSLPPRALFSLASWRRHQTGLTNATAKCCHMWQCLRANLMLISVRGGRGKAKCLFWS